MSKKPYKPATIILAALLAVNLNAFAQVNATQQRDSSDDKADVGVKHSRHTTNSLHLNLNLGHLINDAIVSVNDAIPKLNLKIADLQKDFNVDVDPQIHIDLSDLGNMNFDIDPNINIDLKDLDDGSFQTAQSWDDNAQATEKSKSYSKSYPLDGNDRIKLSNQYGKIIVNTWDKREVKVEVQIKASAEDEKEAQKILDAVQINDSKEGDLVSFKTEIQRNNGSWKIWNRGGRKHKVEINYTVYMPAKTDLDVEDSYGSIQLPDLSGRVKISSSYGSVATENLSNAANSIDVSYGSLHGGIINGAKLDCAYGSAEIEECNNVKADVSYGSFKLRKLTGTGTFDVSYVGGFKIEELASSFKKVNVDASYSSVRLGIPGNNNFDFDVTTTYGGFNYNDDKVTVTSKTPPDGSKHIGPTRNYKGHFGKEGSEAQVKITADYGGVNFD